MSNQEFIAQIGPIIQKVAAEKGYKYPSAIIAQACLESAYGRSSLGYKYHNYFGMKCGSSWSGKSVNLKTSEEYTPGVHTIIKDNFRVYDDMESGVRGYFDFISSKRYSNLKNATSSRNYIELIKADGYATSSAYVTNVYNVVTSNNLTAYDSVPDTSVPMPTVTVKATDPDIVGKILNGEMGNGATRAANVAAAGYIYKDVQAKVNEVLKIVAVLKTQKQTLGDYWDVALKQL